METLLVNGTITAVTATMVEYAPVAENCTRYTNERNGEFVEAADGTLTTAHILELTHAQAGDTYQISSAKGAEFRCQALVSQNVRRIYAGRLVLSGIFGG